MAIQAFNDYRMPLFDYSLIVPVGLFGLRPAAVRLGAAMWGIADLLGLAVLATLIIGLRGAALAVALMALSPWHLPISRFGHEAITAGATTTLAAAALFAGMRLRRGRWLLLSGLLFGMSLYSYSITKAFVPPFLIWTAIVYWRELKPLGRHALAGVMIIAVSALPQAWALWRHYGAMMARFHSLSVLSLPWPLSLRMLVQGWLSDFSPGFLFRNGSPDLALHAPGYGQLLVAQAAMLFLAGCSLGEARFRRVTVFLLGWLAIAGVTAALILPGGHPLHSLLMLTPLTLLSALGMVFLFDLAGASRLARLAVAAAILLVMVIQGASFVSFYFRRYPALAAYDFQYGLGPAVERAAQLGDGPVVITANTNQPYIYVLFFTKYPPQRFQNEPVVQVQRLIRQRATLRPLPLRKSRDRLLDPARTACSCSPAGNHPRLPQPLRFTRLTASSPTRSWSNSAAGRSSRECESGDIWAAASGYGQYGGNLEGIFPKRVPWSKDKTTTSNQDIGVNASFAHIALINNIANSKGHAGIYATCRLVSGNTSDG